METITNLLLPYGSVTIAVLGLIILVLIAAWVYQLGIIIISFLLAFDDNNAPDINLENKILNKLNIFQPKAEDLIVSLHGGWAVVAEWHPRKVYYDKTDKKYGSWSEHYAKKYCIHSSEGSAVAYAKDVIEDGMVLPSLYIKKLGKMLLPLIVLDLLIVSLQLAFLSTVIVCGMVVFTLGVRSLAKKVYKNTKGVNNHEERITKLEENIND